VDAPPVLEPAEHVLNLVPLTIEFAVMFDQHFQRWSASGIASAVLDGRG
jgi:hypothetical protein